MSNNWKSIWQSRAIDKEKIDLSELIRLNGWDSPTGKISIDKWLVYVEQMSRHIGIGKGDTIFEIGCGSGAFLYLFYNKGHEVFGIDYSKALISVAKSIMPRGSFNSIDAIDVETENQFDIVVSNGVFIYFPDLSYAKNVLRKMLQIAKKKVAVLEVNDQNKRGLWMKNRISSLGEEEYRKKYDGLDHLFFTREFFEELAEEYAWDVRFVNTEENIYPAAIYRFGAIFSSSTKR